MATLPNGVIGAIVMSLVIQELGIEQEIVQILRLEVQGKIALVIVLKWRNVTQKVALVSLTTFNYDRIMIVKKWFMIYG